MQLTDWKFVLTSSWTVANKKQQHNNTVCSPHNIPKIYIYYILYITIPQLNQNSNDKLLMKPIRMSFFNDMIL